MNGLNPGQMVIKIVNEEMIKLMGSETTPPIISTATLSAIELSSQLFR